MLCTVLYLMGDESQTQFNLFHCILVVHWRKWTEKMFSTGYQGCDVFICFDIVETNIVTKSSLQLSSY